MWKTSKKDADIRGHSRERHSILTRLVYVHRRGVSPKSVDAKTDCSTLQISFYRIAGYVCTLFCDYRVREHHSAEGFFLPLLNERHVRFPLLHLSAFSVECSNISSPAEEESREILFFSSGTKREKDFFLLKLLFPFLSSCFSSSQFSPSSSSSSRFPVVFSCRHSLLVTSFKDLIFFLSLGIPLPLFYSITPLSPLRLLPLLLLFFVAPVFPLPPRLPSSTSPSQTPSSSLSALFLLLLSLPLSFLFLFCVFFFGELHCLAFLLFKAAFAVEAR